MGVHRRNNRLCIVLSPEHKNYKWASCYEAGISLPQPILEDIGKYPVLGLIGIE